MFNILLISLLYNNVFFLEFCISVWCRSFGSADPARPFISIQYCSYEGW